MSETLKSDDSNKIDRKFVAFIQDIGYLLIKYLKGAHVINFMEAVNGSEQFNTIQISEDHVFHTMFMEMMEKEKMAVNILYLDFYLDRCSIKEQEYSEQYCLREAPL